MRAHADGATSFFFMQQQQTMSTMQSVRRTQPPIGAAITMINAVPAKRRPAPKMSHVALHSSLASAAAIAAANDALELLQDGDASAVAPEVLSEAFWRAALGGGRASDGLEPVEAAAAGWGDLAVPELALARMRDALDCRGYGALRPTAARTHSTAVRLPLGVWQAGRGHSR